AVDREAVMAQHAGHPRTNKTVDDKDAGNDRKGKSGHASRDLEHEECADHTRDDVARRELSAGAEEKTVELPPNVNGASCRGGRENPVVPRNTIGTGPQERGRDKEADRHPPTHVDGPEKQRL